MEPFNPLTSPLKGQLLIEASAGTGKTYSIALLYLRLILERQLEVDEILVVTFTVAATDELRTRIRSRIRELLDLLERPEAEDGGDAMLAGLMSSLSDSEDAKQRLQDALTRMDEAAIYTIHSFCQRMLQDHAFESGMPLEVDFLESEESLRTRIMEDFWRQRFYQATSAETEWVLANWQGPNQLIRDLHGLLTKPVARTVPPVTAQEEREASERGRVLWQEVRETWSQSADEVMEMLENNPCLSKNQKDGYHPDHLQTAFDNMNYLVSLKEPPWVLPDRVELFSASIMAEKQLKNKIAPVHPFFTLFGSFYQCQTDLIRSARIHTFVEAQGYLRKELDRRKRQQGQMYFTDLLVRLDQALSGRRGGKLAQHIRSQFKVALVDEFQDTDPLQYRIFHALFGRGDDPGLFMIGDPKQSIYSFRGADIFAYMEASRNTPDSSSFTMDTNYRSTSAMVAAVNRLFDRNGSFVFTGEIDFHPVCPCPGADDKPLLIQGVSPQPLQVQLLSVEADATPGQRTISKERAASAAAEWTAQEVACLLTMAQRGEAHIDDKPLSGGDIAILVRTHREAELMQGALRNEDIASVYYSQDSVFESEEARQVHQILRALLDLTDESQVCNALVTDLFGLNANMLFDLRKKKNVVEWDTVLLELADYQSMWRNFGVTAMFHRLFHKQNVVSRLISISGGERKLTNFLHLVELLQETSARYSGDDLVNWLSEQVRSPEKNASNQQLRLESDEDLVKIVTIHKAKGLEYPVVFLPFLWSARTISPDEPFACHIQEDGKSQLVVDLWSGDEEHYRQAEKERLAEDLRILYVALTRARHCCYLTWGRISKMEQSALAWLLHRGEGDSMVSAAKCTEEKIAEDLEALNSELVCCVSFEDEAPPSSLKPQERSLSVRSFTGHIDTSWTVTSYSRLSAPQAGIPHIVQPVSSSADESKEDRGLSVFTFPKGAVAGNCLHGLLESFDFARFTADELQELALDRLKKNGYDRKWAPILVRWMEDIVATPLDTSSVLRLDQIPQGDRKVEMGFYFGMHDFDPARFNEILADFGMKPVAMSPDRLQGLMKGYIDLIFRSGEQYYILDYKSNYLGPDHTFYTPDRLQEGMQEHRYDLQYLIYTVALHRFLKGRLAHYDYNRHVGGVFYLFLRGLHPDQGPASGVWYEMPPFELIERLDNCFGLGGVR